MLSFTQGDTALLELTATDGNGDPVDITGAVITTQIKGPNGVVVTFPNSQHTVNPDQVNFMGQFTLALATTDTSNCGIGPHKDILSQIVQGSSTIFFRGLGILAVNPPVPLQ